MTDSGIVLASKQPTLTGRLRWSAAVTSVICGLIIGYATTGGKWVQTCLVALPVALAFTFGGHVGGLLSICGSLTAYTGVIAVLDLVRPKTSIHPGITYATVTLGIAFLSFTMTTGQRSSLPEKSIRVPWEDAAVLLVALVSGYLALRWTRSTDLQFLNSIGGSEDNAAWISGTRTFVEGTMTPGFLAHPTAKSPVTGTLLGFFADIHALSERGTPQHLVALRALRTAYAFLITTTALAAVLWVTGVARRAGTIRSVSVIASVAIGVSVVGITSQLFVGYGFLSFINGIAFLLIVLVGFDFVFGDLLLRPIS